MKPFSYYIQPWKGINRLRYYLHAFSSCLIPAACYRRSLRALFQHLSQQEREVILRRTAYYLRLPEQMPIAPVQTTVGDFHYRPGMRHTKYVMDLREVVRYFPRHMSFNYLFGDVTTVPLEPTFVKSRPIAGDVANSVLLKLNKWRHFVFVKDKLSYTQKRDQLVFRNVVRQPWRRLLLERYFGHPLCELGQINRDGAEQHPEWVRPYMTLEEQLQYKFVACIEGNDVATSLKWVMSSNSVAVMPRPRFETWFMEGTLIPDYHYIEVRPDYADLEEKLRHYISHPTEAETIIHNAHVYVHQFQNTRIEKLTGLEVAAEYFRRTGQTEDRLL